ncbi:MAG: 2-dehydro-3-deoxyphosphogluconate aldolase / (4S)-4-hydroxy-2-oxoglutarate aldolase [Mycobacterium sp.]|nr:2-dehydro-3-deoxyphosphogluconate aldolase / (4S)-4-hydroxy-2-oxoglutarate aldolase [Mycobacterium sp.]
MSAVTGPLPIIASDRVVSVVRADRAFDVGSLVVALNEGGIRAVELTLTTPGILTELAHTDIACRAPGAVLGVGTVLTAEQADDAIDAGAQFLVTPALSESVARAAAARGVPVIMGALTPTEVRAAIDMGADAVKIFPARALGPDYLRDLHGPFPGIPLIPSGGVNAANAAGFLQAGALAVTAGTDVVAPDLVSAGQWATITERAATFVRAIADRDRG